MPEFSESTTREATVRFYRTVQNRELRAREATTSNGQYAHAREARPSFSLAESVGSKNRQGAYLGAYKYFSFARLSANAAVRR